MIELKLKTLKDFELIGEEITIGGTAQRQLIRELRQEAIKRIKYYRNQIDNGTADDDYVMSGRIKELMEFFNLIEEDLK